MTRATATIVLCVLLLAAWTYAVNNLDNNDADDGNKLKSFRAGYEYIFQYDSQIAVGLVDETENRDTKKKNYGNAGENQPQKATTRFQCQVKVAFDADDQSTLRLDKLRVGELNGPLPFGDSNRVHPMAIFEKSALAPDQSRQLRLPCRFAYVNGLVDAVKFESEDTVFSRNIKRAVLNLFQLNLQPENIKKPSEEDKLYLIKSYTVAEENVEGDCETTYSINSNDKLRYSEENGVNVNENDRDKLYFFNVTKTMHFGRCKRTVDAVFGAESAAIIASNVQCAKCLRLNFEEKEMHYNEYKHSAERCGQICDQRVINQKMSDRSTMIRYVCQGPSDMSECALQRAELLSYYVYKSGALAESMPTEEATSGTVPSTQLAAVVAAEMDFIDAIPVATAQKRMSRIDRDSRGVESILFDDGVQRNIKKFYALGDSAFRDNEKLPFADVKNKVEQATRTYNALINAVSEMATGVEVNVFVVHMPRIVHYIRMASANELQKIVTETFGQADKQKYKKAQKMRDLVADTLAMAGTANSVDQLIRMVENNEISESKVIHSLTFMSTTIPSSRIAKRVLQACKSGRGQRQAGLRRVCMLSASTLIGNACRVPLQNKRKGTEEKNAKNDNQREGENREKQINYEICSKNDKQLFIKALLDEYNLAESLTDKILVTRVLGNAGFVEFIDPLMKMASRRKSSSQNAQRNRDDDNANIEHDVGDDEVIIRLSSLEALRFILQQRPRKMQRILKPIFEDRNERRELRLLALTGLLVTNPPPVIIDEIVYHMQDEPSADVKAYTRDILKVYAKRQSKINRQLARHIRAAIQRIRLTDEEKVQRSSMYSEMSDETTFAKFAAPKKREMLNWPTLIYANTRSIFVDEQTTDFQQTNGIGVEIAQVNISKWLENVLKLVVKTYYNGANRNVGRGQRANNVEAIRKNAAQQLRAIFETLGIKKRCTNGKCQQNANANDEEDRKTTGVLSLRMANIDKMIFSVTDETLPPVLRTIFNGKSLSVANLREFDALREGQFDLDVLSAIDLHEFGAVIPTSMGIPLNLRHYNPIFTSIDGEIKTGFDFDSGVSAKFHIHPSVCAYRMAKLEAEWPHRQAAGVESMRAIEVNAPLQGKLALNAKEQMKLVLETPKTPKTRLLGIHTLTTTYTMAFDTDTNNFLNAKMKAVYSPVLEPHQIDMDKTIGEHNFGLPIRVNGHFHMPPKSPAQSTLQYLIALTRVSVVSENHLHVTFEPNTDTPRAFIFGASANAFEAVSDAENAKENPLQNFYSSPSNRFNEARGQQSNKMPSKYNEQNEKLNNFLTKISKESTQMYKHTLKLSVQSHGGTKQTKAEAQLSAICDPNLKHCKFNGDVKRTPMLASESEWWVLKANAALALPETVSSLAELKALEDSKNQRMVLNANAEWGPAKSQDSKRQYIKLRVQAESKTKRALSRVLALLVRPNPESDNESAESQRIRRQSAFLNKIDMSADYKLSPRAQNAFVRTLELLKAYYAWNSWSTPVNASGINKMTIEECTPSNSAKRCSLHASMEIDTINQCYANLTIRTVSQMVHIKTFELPYRMRPFPLISAKDASIHSTHQLIKRFADEQMDASNAKCTVGDNGVTTFDGTRYNAPIINCYTVLANDCAWQKFTVLMKAITDDNGMLQKKIKVITPNDMIKCHTNGNSNKKIECSKNDETIDSAKANQYGSYGGYSNGGENLIEYNNNEQTMVEIRNAKLGLTVKFGCKCAECACQKAVIKLDKRYKNAQCGICGHYDDKKSAEFRDADGAEAEKLHEFVRSYTLHDQKECPKESRDKMFNKNSHKYALKESRDEKMANENGNENYDGYAFYEEQKSGENDGHWESDEESKFVSTSFNGKKMRNGKAGKEKKNDDYEDPELRTHVVEYNHQICFSVDTVKKCAEGTTPKTSADLADMSADSKASSDFIKSQKVPLNQSNNENEITTVKFVCLPRSEPQTRRMQKEAKRGVVLGEALANYSPNYSQKINVPVKCLKYAELY